MTNQISVVVVSDSHEKLQMAAMVASVGAVSGNDVRVFVSMNALAFFVKGAARNAPPEGVVGNLLVSKNAPSFLELFKQAVELGDAKIYPCSMAMDLLQLGEDALLPYVGKSMGLTKFLGDASEAQVWTF